MTLYFSNTSSNNINTLKKKNIYTYRRTIKAFSIRNILPISHKINLNPASSRNGFFGGHTINPSVYCKCVISCLIANIILS